MPKKTFRSSNSTVVVKRNKFGSITKRKLVSKRQKLILVDEKNENNWKYLKSELGYKTDSLFLEYLLNLAQKDLNAFRSKKRQISNENEESLKVVDRSSSLINEKQNELLPGFQIEPGKVFVPAENENKRDIWDGHKTKGGNRVDESREETTESEEDEETTYDKRLPNSQRKKAKEKRWRMNFPDDESTKTNMKTETAKDFELDCISITDRNRGQTIDELSSFKDLNLCNSSDRNFFSQCKNTSAMEVASSLKMKNDSSVRSSKKERGNSKDKNVNSQVVDEESRRKGRRQSKLDGSKCQTQGVHLVFKSEKSEPNKKENETGIKSAVNIRLCVGCNKRHSNGKCPNDVSSQSDVNNTSDKRHKEGTSGGMEGNSDVFYYEDRNVYDFDDSEREINLEGNNRWCHKLLKTKEPAEEKSDVAAKSDDAEDFILVGVNDDENDSDSSDSSLKLRIDESFDENVSYAESSLPDNLMLKVYDEEHGQSVFTKTSISKSTHFGPMIGQKIREMDIPDYINMKFIWEVNTAAGVTYLSTKDEESSNWLRFLRPANSRESANLKSCIKENELYFISIKDIKEGEELVYWMDDIHSPWSRKKLEKKNCGGCNIQFAHPLYYRKHCMIFHDPSCSLTIRKYHCKICGLAILGKEKIVKHAAEMHQGKGAYQCQYCHKFFLRLNYLEMHRTYGCSKNPQRSRPLCDLCGRKFCQPQKLKVHIKRMHSDMSEVLKDFQCKSCLKILGSRAALQRHMKEVHNKDIVGACTCDRCGKMFQNKSNLKIHMLTHSGVKPFKCQQTDCTAAFTTKQCLQFHYKKVHGFTDDFIPKIERSIAYTFDAYSGGTVSEPIRGPSPKFEEHTSPLPEQRECCLDLSLVTSPAENARGKEKVQPDTGGVSLGVDDSKLMQHVNHRYPTRDEAYDKSPELESGKRGDGINGRKFVQDVAVETNQVNKIMFCKGNKKWMVAESEKTDERLRSIFRPENANAGLLVEAAITAAEKGVVERPVDKPSPSNQEVMDNVQEMYSINQYVANSPEAMYDSNDKKLDEYGKLDDGQTGDGDVTKKSFQIGERSNFNDFLRCSSLLRINTSPVNEMPKDYNISSIVRDQENESFTDIEIQDYRNRDLLESYKESENFQEQYRAHELYRSEKFDLYRGESDLRMSTIDKLEYRDFDVSNETYRNLASNLEKYRNSDIYRLRSEGYELGVGYRELCEERDGEAQNLCLKEKSFQYETLEELARIGRDNPGFECLLVGESGSTANSQTFNSAAPRALHGMLSPRPYHPPYESESVDLSVPRPSYSSSPIYTLDLTPTRVELPARHLDFRSHLALSPHRFPNSRLPGLSNGGAQVSPTGYSVYSNPYVAPAARHSPTSQFQPYTSLYY